MKTFVRLLSLVLAFLMVASVLVSCGGNKDDNKDNKETNDGIVASTNSDTEEGPKTKLPEINWENREYRILGRQYTEDIFTNFEVDRDEMPEDVVGVAVWNRNETLKAKYGIDVVGNLVEQPHEEAKIFLEAGDDLYDLFMCRNTNMQSFGMAGHLINIRALEYIDLENECWNSYANEQLTFGGKLYYTTNKFLLQDKHRTWIIWYNRTLANELNAGYLEQEVFDGTWTIDRFIELSKTCSQESDGQEGMTAGDTWGVTLHSAGQFAQLIYGCGFRLSNMQKDGFPELVGPTDAMLSIIDKVLDLVLDTEHCYVQSLRPTDTDNKNDIENTFREGRAVSMVHAVSWLSNLSRVNFEYGVLPLPKYTEEQESYYCTPNIGNASLFAIPATVNDVKFAAFALEAISEESVDTTYTEYIETKCKLQVAYDEDMSKCFRIIFDSIVYDIAFIDGYGGLDKVIATDIIQSGTNIYGRQYSKYERKANNQMKKTKDAYAALPY